MLCFLSLIVLYSILLVLSFCIPQAWIESNRLSSVRFLSREGLHPAPLYGNTVLDNYTDNGAMLGRLQPFTGDPLHQAFSIYARYWNGWAVLVRPALVLGNITVIRVMQSSVMLVLLCFAFHVLTQRIGVMYALLFLAALLPARLDLVAVSLQYSHIFWIALGAVIWLCRKERQQPSLCMAFLTIGSLTNYVDVLTAPVLTLTIPLIVVIILQCLGGAPRRQRIALPAMLAALWGCGYAGTWIAKWGLSSLVTGQNVFANAAHQAERRTVGTLDGSDIHPTWQNTVTAITKQFLYRGDILFLLGMFAFIVVGYLVYRRTHRQRPNHLPATSRQDLLATIATLCVVSLIALLWATIMMQHTQLHAWMTYRILCGTLLSMLSILWVSIRAITK